MYHYEYIDGTKASKPDICIDMAGGPRVYFDSPFVRMWQHVSDEQKPNAKCHTCGQRIKNV